MNTSSCLTNIHQVLMQRLHLRQPGQQLQSPVDKVVLLASFSVGLLRLKLDVFFGVEEGLMTRDGRQLLDYRGDARLIAGPFLRGILVKN